MNQEVECPDCHMAIAESEFKEHMNDSQKDELERLVVR